jgi:hypothetical protein
VKKALFAVIALTLLPAALLTIPQNGTPRETVQAFITDNCLSCHNGRSRVGGLNLEDKDLSRIRQDANVWEKVARRLRVGLDPPLRPGVNRPDPATMNAVMKWLEVELDRDAPPFLRPPGIHRLNGTEYGNAIRDLLGLEIDPASFLPGDDTAYGFDNIASVLGMPTGHAQAFTAAATKIAAQAMANATATQRILLCRPAGAAEEEPCVRRIITGLARNAFRGQSSSEDVDALMQIYRSQRTGASFNKGIEAALQRILADRKFIYRIEAEPANLAPGQSYRLSDLALASRLSYFLWSRAPDEPLLRLATAGQLSNPSVLDNEVRRMLQDPRSEALAVNFAGQWLNFRHVRSMLTVEAALTQAMRREGELFFDSIVREDRNVVDLLTADYTFVNERLARHYGLPNVTGTQFRRVTLGPEFDVRRGLLGKGSILTTTSNDDRNNIVARAKWVMEKVLGVSPPPPPPDVFAFNPTPTLPLRPQLSAHMTLPRCALCHDMIDPYGLALENFDRTGAWRELEAGVPVDASAKLVDGRTINGPAELRNALLQYSDAFVQALTEKLFIYALGRNATYQDMPAIRAIARDASREGNRFSAIVLGIVRSKAFQNNAKE